MDPMTAVALGSGLTSLGRGIRGYQADQEDTRRYNDAAKARAAEADEARKLRTRLAEMEDEQRREARRQAAMQRVTEFYGKQGVVLSPDAARQLAEADAQGPNAPPGTTDAMVALATGAESTVPTGDEMARSPVDNGYTMQTPGIRSRITESARQALERSRAEKGSRVQLDGGLGFARDEDAFDAARRAEEAAATNAMRELVARITASGRAPSGGGSGQSINALINDQEQVLAGAEKKMPKRSGLSTIVGGAPIDMAADSSFRADSSAAAGGISRERDRLNALKTLRGDSQLMRGAGAEGLSVGTPPTAAGFSPGQENARAIAAQAQEAIRRIQAKANAGEISPVEAMTRIRAVKQRAAEMAAGPRR